MDKKEETKYTIMKLWNFLKKKSIKSRNIKKISSEYDNDENLQQLSDNESDKTTTEIINKKKFIERGRKASSLKSNNSNDIKLYDKRDNSLDIIRNKDDDYEVVMQYQRYANYRTKK
tara:strand:- start:1677 stop:2027 length:351 start_codon:yes stop_codon:yes gene_type:complete